MNLIKVLSAIMFSSFCVLAESVPDIIKKADEGRLPSGQIIFFASVQDYKGSQLERTTLYKVYNDGQEASAVHTIEPKRLEGRNLLMKGNNLWFMTPDTKKPARVSMQQKLTGEISNGDLARTDFAGDYDGVEIGREKVDGVDCIKLALKAKRKDVTYSKIDYWVQKGSYLPAKATFYALSGKPLKYAVYQLPKMHLGRKRITQITMTDALDKNKRSVLVYSNIKKGKIPAKIFSKDGLDD